MDTIKKQEGFKNENLIVLPGDFVRTSSAHPLIQPVYITDIGFFPDAQYHYRHREHGGDQNILIYCVKGEGFLYINDRKRVIKKDTFFVIPKGTPHNYGSDENNPWTIYWVHFLGSNAENYFNVINNDFCMANISIEKSSKVKLLFDEMLSFLENGYTLETMIYVSQMLANLLGVLFFMNSDYKLGLKEDNIPIEDSILYMTKNLETTLTLKQLAKQANLSITHYSYLFKKKTGFSPIDYFIRLKIQRACHYLTVTDMKVNDVAKALGFQDPYYFSRAFHKIMQQSPTAYRYVKKG